MKISNDTIIGAALLVLAGAISIRILLRGLFQEDEQIEFDFDKMKKEESEK